MGLKREHIAIYEPFDLEWYDVDDGIKTMHGIIGNDVILEMDGPDIVVQYNFTGSYEGTKPLFRRLSQITKEITHNGETFIPAQRIAMEGYKFAKYDPKIGYGYKKIGQMPGEKIGYLPLDILNWPYVYFIQLVAMHFDVYSKIDSGDASVKK